MHSGTNYWALDHDAKHLPNVHTWGLVTTDTESTAKKIEQEHQWKPEAHNTEIAMRCWILHGSWSLFHSLLSAYQLLQSKRLTFEYWARVHLSIRFSYSQTKVNFLRTGSIESFHKSTCPQSSTTNWITMTYDVVLQSSLCSCLNCHTNIIYLAVVPTKVKWKHYQFKGSKLQMFYLTIKLEENRKLEISSLTNEK